MNFKSLLIQLDQWMLLHLGMLITGLVATLLTVYGNRINGTFAKWTRSWNFILRYLGFVLLCTLGYAFLTDWLILELRHVISLIPREWRVGSIILSFAILALLAKREKQL